MSCILYKDGNEVRVKAESVEFLIERGFSPTRQVKTRKPRKVKEKEIQGDLIQADLSASDQKVS